MLSMTVNEILESSLRAIHVISPTESVSSGQAKTAKQALNIMLSLWSTKGLVVQVITRESLTLTADKASYTIGASGDFNTARPMAIYSAMIDSGDSDYPMRIIGTEEYNAISVKTNTGVPDMLYTDFTFPLATMYPYPIPDAAYGMTINKQVLFTDYTSLTTSISLPPEYYAAIKWNLAIELCPDYEREPSQTIIVLAERTLDAIMTLNAANRLEPIKQSLGLEPGMPGRGLGTGGAGTGPDAGWFGD